MDGLELKNPWEWMEVITLTSDPLPCGGFFEITGVNRKGEESTFIVSLKNLKKGDKVAVAGYFVGDERQPVKVGKVAKR
jgi:lysophospholipid acyltransferase (LPLAT)-like uncharacterized protein